MPFGGLVMAVIGSLVGLGIILHRTHLEIAANRTALVYATVVAVLLAIRQAAKGDGRPRLSRIGDFAEDTLLFMIITLAGAVASYAVAALTVGWVDGAMARFDRAIGFDWNMLYALTAAHPVLQIGGRIAYASIFVSPILIIGSFALNAQRDESRRFLAAFWVAAMISLFLFRFMPTLGPLDYSWHGPIRYVPTSGLYQSELIPLLRMGHMSEIDLGALRGLVGPPSFHAASAVLYIIAGLRSRQVRIPVVAINVVMLFAIPVEGTHYAIDVLAGAAVAGLAYALVDAFSKRRLA